MPAQATLKIIKDIVLKTSETFSGKLSQKDKYPVKAGKELELQSYAYARNHAVGRIDDSTSKRLRRISKSKKEIVPMNPKAIPLCRNNCCPSLFIEPEENGVTFVLEEGDVRLSLTKQHMDAIVEAYLNWEQINDSK